MHRRSFALLIALLGTAAGAEVIRCADAAGNVGYTDGACPAGARPVGRVALPEATPPSADGAAAAKPAPVQRERAEGAAPPPPPPSGPIVIDARGGSVGEPAADSRWSDRGGDPMLVDEGYAYPGGAYRRPPPPRDMRPRIRNCDAGGCEDRQGNRYDRSGQLERYQGLDGRTCRPVGTTTVCR
ncbi:DUF4124 domain-containing protein [Variovorax saccharolyticus]|uniref:DUF4124 domain-containing protein n=1 Tax=Variovorax saccharolyticus TaxID=3053516 RepID=UPI002576AF02|nr:DUF4124 domain-containing protein [Variovorax sp. J22R187]MDM0018791.1 DUF4124 domain-containing protein [Variovorax sp. J22R187]